MSDKQLERAASTLSAKVDELRELAGDGSMEWVAGLVRASVLRDAADTIDKLRELSSDLCACHMRGSCDKCDFNVGADCLMFFEKRMRELGVEVDG